MKAEKGSRNSRSFWKISKNFVSHHLPDIRKCSPNTVTAYRNGINAYIDYLETEKHIHRQNVTFEDFGKKNLTDYLDWMLNERKYAEKTCNLKLTAIHSLLEFAANESSENYMGIYLDSKVVKGLQVHTDQIEFFEDYQMKALLAAPDTKTKTGKRNQMMLILYYDTAVRIAELIEMEVNQLHLDSEVPYVTILGKGRKYRNIPLMEKTVKHLRLYLKEFHEDGRVDVPLFYAKSHGVIHHLSHDTVENMIKKYTRDCQEKGITMPAKPHCHMIRKTRAMNLYKNGIPLTHIQQMLGHENLSTTSGFYAFATLDTLAKSMKIANKETSSSGMKWNQEDVKKRIYSL